jgi:hypothetical protein
MQLAAPAEIVPSQARVTENAHLDQMFLHLDPAKFRDPAITAKGENRATVALRALETLWFNTGTLCNLTCRN